MSNRTTCHALHFLNIDFKVTLFTLLFLLHQEALLFLFTFCYKGGVICISEVVAVLLWLFICSFFLDATYKWPIEGEKVEAVTDFIFLGSKITADGDCRHEIKRRLLLGRKATTNLDNVLKSRDITLLKKVHIVKAMGFPSGHVHMWELDHKEGWVLKNWCFRTVVLKTLESPLDCKEIKLVSSKENQPWIFIGRTDAEAEASILWPPDAKNWLIGKDPDAGTDWKQKEKRTGKDEMAGCLTDSMDMYLSKLQETVKNRRAWCGTVHGVAKSWTRLSDSTSKIMQYMSFSDLLHLA